MHSDRLLQSVDGSSLSKSSPVIFDPLVLQYRSSAKSVAPMFVFWRRCWALPTVSLQLPIPLKPAGQRSRQSQLMLFLSANQSSRSPLSTNQSAAGSHSTLKLRENKEVGGPQRERAGGGPSCGCRPGRSSAPRPTSSPTTSTRLATKHPRRVAARAAVER